MAARVEGTSSEGSQAAGTTSSLMISTKNKPGLAPKPLLTPKPFSLQRNTTIRSIHAPKTATTTAPPTSKNVVPTAVTAETTTVSNSGSKPSETGISTEKTDKSETQQTNKPEATNVLKVGPATAVKPSPQLHTTTELKPSSRDVHTKDQLEPTKENEVSQGEKHGPDPSSFHANSNNSTTSQTFDPKTNDPNLLNPTTQPEGIQKPVITQRSHKVSTDDQNHSLEREKEKGGETQTSVMSPAIRLKPEDSGSNTSSTASPSANPTACWGVTRKRLPTELTSKFQSSGLSLPLQPGTTSATSTKDGGNKPLSSDPECSPMTSAPPNIERDEGGLNEGEMEDRTGGSSIKRRISLLLNSSSHPEVTKREEPQIISQPISSGGVKERIKNWTADPTSEPPKAENKPQPLPRARTMR